MQNRACFWAIIVCGFLVVNAAGSSPAAAQTWTKLSPIGEPPAAGAVSIWGYDEATKRLITLRYTPEPWPGTFDVWALTNADGLGAPPEWMQVNADQHSYTNYPVAFFHDALKNQGLVLIARPCPGGYSVELLTNANGMGGSSQWEGVCVANARTLNVGGEDRVLMGFPASVYDPNTARLIVAGGGLWGDPWTITDHVWVLTNANGMGGDPTWERLYPVGTPPRVDYDSFMTPHALYDATTNRAIFLMNQRAQDYIPEVWVLTNANGLGGTPEWVELHPTGDTPPPQVLADPAYDPDTNRLILFGGYAGQSHVWVLTNANGLGGQPEWILLPTANGPCAGSAFAGTFGVVFDRTSNQLIMVAWQQSEVWVLTHANGITNEPPVANAGPDQTVIVGESAQFDGSASHDPDGSIASFDWTFGDGASANGAVVNHVCTGAGQFVVTLTVTDGQGANASDTALVTVRTTAQAIQSLSELVQGYNLAQGIFNSLDAKLTNALDALNAANTGQRQDAANKLQAFINSVEAQRGKELTSAQADTLIAFARRVLGVI